MLTEVHDGLRVSFSFGRSPTRGSRLKVVWFYNNKEVASIQKPRAGTVNSIVLRSNGLPVGFWRAALRVRVPGSTWKTVKEIRTRLA
jgi:hypothetical protein